MGNAVSRNSGLKKYISIGALVILKGRVQFLIALFLWILAHFEVDPGYTLLFRV